MSWSTCDDSCFFAGMGTLILVVMLSTTSTAWLIEAAYNRRRAVLSTNFMIWVREGRVDQKAKNRGNERDGKGGKRIME